MFVKQSARNGKVYLSLAQGYRIEGKVRHKTIEKIGYVKELEKIYDDPIGHFKQIAKEQSKSQVKERSIEMSLGEQLAPNTATRKNLGYAVAKHIYEDIGIRDFFQSKQKHLRVSYNLNHIFSLLVYNRFLYPSSKRRAYEKRGMFFEAGDFSLDNLYRALPTFASYAEELQSYVHRMVGELMGRDTEIGYYDVTNYYFEIPYNDEDRYDTEGKEVKKGFRKKGPSKEHRPDPIVQMGLLMDTNGIPIAFDLFSGGESEKTSLLPIIRRVKRDYGLQRIIAVADRGLNTSQGETMIQRIEKMGMCMAKVF